MAGVSVRVIEETGEFKKEIKRLEAAIDKPPSRFHKNAGEYMLRSIEKNFRAEGRPVKWLPVKPATRKRKKNPKILTESRRLRRSITYAAFRKWGLVLGTNAKYARIHQNGGLIKHPGGSRTMAFNKKGRFMSKARASKSKRGAARGMFVNVGPYTIRMPARPFLVIQEADKKALGEMAVEIMAGKK